MALEASVKEAALRVADALHRYAAVQGWPRDRYRIYMTVNPEWGTCFTTFVCDAFETGDEREDLEQYDLLKDFLEDDLKDDPELYYATTVQTVGRKGFALFGKPRAIGDWIVIDEELLNPAVGSGPKPSGVA